MRRTSAARHGFTILELMVATGIFMIICGALMSQLLNLSQKKYNSENPINGGLSRRPSGDGSDCSRF